MKDVKDFLENIEDLLLKDKYIELSALINSKKYLNLSPLIYNLDGNQVIELVDESLNRFGSNNLNELTLALQAGSSKTDLNNILICDSKIIIRILGMIFWMEKIFHQFDQFVFKARTQQAIFEYTFQNLNDKIFQPQGKKLIQALISLLVCFKQLPNSINGRLNKLLKFVLSFHEKVSLEGMKILQNQATKRFGLFSDRNYKSYIQSYLFCQKLERKKVITSRYDLIKKKICIEGNKQFENSLVISTQTKDIPLETNESAQKQTAYQNELEDLLKTEVHRDLSIQFYQQCVNWDQTSDPRCYQTLKQCIKQVLFVRIKYEFDSFKDSNSFPSMLSAIETIEQMIFEWMHMFHFYFYQNCLELQQLLQSQIMANYFPVLLKNQHYGLDNAIDNKLYETLGRLFQFSFGEHSAIKLLSLGVGEYAVKKLQDIEMDQVSLMRDYQEKRDCFEITSKQGCKKKRVLDYYYQEILTEDESQILMEFQSKWWKRISLLLSLLNKINEECFCWNNQIIAAFQSAFKQQLCHSEFFFDYFDEQCNLLFIELNEDSNGRRECEILKSNKNINILLKIIPISERFLEKYRLRLAQRLLHKLSRIQDEKDMIQKIEGVAGKRYLLKAMENMIDDLEKNNIIRQDFINNMEENQDQLEDEEDNYEDKEEQEEVDEEEDEDEEEQKYKEDQMQTLKESSIGFSELKIKIEDEDEGTFQQHYQINYDFTNNIKNVFVNILSKKEWPLEPSHYEIKNLPKNLKSIYNKYTAAYHKEFKRRKLSLDHSNSFAEIYVKSNKQTLLVSNPTMIILLGFNSNEYLTAHDIAVVSGIPIEVIKMKMFILVQKKILRIVKQNGNENDEDDYQGEKEEIMSEKKKKIFEVVDEQIQDDTMLCCNIEEIKDNISNMNVDKDINLMDTQQKIKRQSTVIDVDVLCIQNNYSDEIRGMLRGKKNKIEIEVDKQQDKSRNSHEFKNDLSDQHPVFDSLGGSLKRTIITAMMLRIIKEKQSMKREELIEYCLQQEKQQKKQNNSNNKNYKNINSEKNTQHKSDELLKMVISQVLDNLIKEGYIQKLQDSDNVEDILMFKE